jgi:hypothetical protein
LALTESLDLNDLMSRGQTARYLSERGVKVAPATLAKHACWGTDSPPFRRVGRRVVYLRTEVDRWLREKLSPPFGSTAEHDDHATQQKAGKHAA